MFSLSDGRPIARILGGKDDGEILFLKKDADKQKCCTKCSKKCVRRPCCRYCSIEDNWDVGTKYVTDGRMEPLMNPEERSVNFVAGPSGSGKSTHAAKLIENYKKIFPHAELIIFSRTDAKNDPAYKHIHGHQVEINDKLLENPIDIEKELVPDCILLFDDVNTIQNDKHKKEIDKLMSDAMEVGRKLRVNMVMTNHLLIPNEKKFARTLLNELQTLTFFPKSGSTHQIRYVLKTYFGLNNKQIEKILKLPSRWVTISKNYPMYVLCEKQAYLLND